MSNAPTRDRGAPDLDMGFRTFVFLIASLMAVNALGTDTMLPALPEIGHSLGVTVENQRQWIISAYMFGLGTAQIFYGPLGDRYGRKPVVMLSMGLFVLTSIMAAFATSLEMMVIARWLQGVAAAGSRVLAVSIVRDCYSGRQMARITSLSFMVLLAVPILAPSFGQIVMLAFPWESIFVIFALYGLAMLIWVGVKLPETLHPEYRIPISPAVLIGAIRQVVTTRSSIGYAVASACMFGAMMGFLNSAQQLFDETFHARHLFPVIFACAAGTMGAAAYFNSRIVERFGTRRISHSALCGFISVSAIHVAAILTNHESLLLFSLCQAAIMGCMGLAGSNFSAMAMEEMGHIAGTASSIQGTISTVGGAVLGLIVGQSFDGTSLPMALGFLCFGFTALVIVLITEKGKLFHAHHAPPVAA
ncbi:multidrug effflux MFS transporter [Flavisphingomonas formosensis]|uniref:multidrug effflux MFS transporter n=1 Tax=Flavisphingomonas formosensis TaxID=861534 RepID=UPI0018DFB455|nr:multidrug effflux MFS transporter [Sphingomonas formosensis]